MQMLHSCQTGPVACFAVPEVNCIFRVFWDTRAKGEKETVPCSYGPTLYRM